jgi:hypothetical protein
MRAGVRSPYQRRLGCSIDTKIACECNAVGALGVNAERNIARAPAFGVVTAGACHFAWLDRTKQIFRDGLQFSSCIVGPISKRDTGFGERDESEMAQAFLQVASLGCIFVVEYV